MSELRKTDGDGLFFVTLTIAGWVDVFTRPVYVEELLKNLRFCQEERGLELYAYVIMSSHLHLIARRNDGDLTELLGRFKSTTSKKLLKLIAEHEHESRREWLLYLFEYFAQPLKQQENYMFWQKNQPPRWLVDACRGASENGVHPHESGRSRAGHGTASLPLQQCSRDESVEGAAALMLSPSRICGGAFPSRHSLKTNGVGGVLGLKRRGCRGW